MDIILKSIDQSNWRECIKLEVAEEQKSFIPLKRFEVRCDRFIHSGPSGNNAFEDFIVFV